MLHYKQGAPDFVKGGHRPKPFPGKFPTRIFYKLTLRRGSTVIYTGKPNVEVMLRLRRLIRANQVRQYTLAEFDRSGAFAFFKLDMRFLTPDVHHVSERFWRTYHPFYGADPTLSCFAAPFKMLQGMRENVKWTYYNFRKRE
jgi:hypothetical protein